MEVKGWVHGLYAPDNSANCMQSSYTCESFHFERPEFSIGRPHCGVNSIRRSPGGSAIPLRLSLFDYFLSFLVVGSYALHVVRTINRLSVGTKRTYQQQKDGEQQELSLTNFDLGSVETLFN